MKVSIILPVYNGERHLTACLEAISGQTLDDMEVICIDDGSTDLTAHILKHQASKDPRFRVVHSPRCGQGAARNRGLQMARGEYVGFVDADDLISPKMYSRLYQAAQHHDSHMAMCFTQPFHDKTQQLISLQYYDHEKKLLLKSGLSCLKKKHILALIPYISMVCWNKIYQRQWLINCGATFDHAKKYEDLPFSFKALMNTNGLAIAGEELYYYRACRNDSVMGTVTRHNYNIIFDVLDNTRSQIKEELSQNRASPKMDHFEVRQLVLSAHTVFWCTQLQAVEKKAFYYRMRRRLQNIPLPGSLPLSFKAQFLMIKFNVWIAIFYTFSFKKYRQKADNK